MVGVKKFSAIAAVSMVAVSGAAASIQQHDASHAHHVLAHRALTDRQPQLIKVQKRLAATIGDGLGGIINGLGRDLGLNGTYPLAPQAAAIHPFALLPSFRSRAAPSRLRT
jgi:hypothetical protein